MEVFWLCIGFVVLPFAAWGLWALLAGYVFPPKKSPARLKKKEVIEQETLSGRKIKKYRLVFSVDEKRKSYLVSPEDYILARVSEDGVLTTRGPRFLSFERNGKE